jgi:hypothetical protein
VGVHGKVPGIDPLPSLAGKIETPLLIGQVLGAYPCFVSQGRPPEQRLRVVFRHGPDTSTPEAFQIEYRRFQNRTENWPAARQGSWPSG